MRRYYYNIKARISFFLRNRRHHSSEDIPKIALLYFIPKSNKSKYANWRDGFTRAIEHLSEDFHFTWINIADRKPSAEELNKFEFIIAKSGWHAQVDQYLRSLKKLHTPRGIVVSCSHPIKEDFVLFYYDVVWYQSFYNRKFVKKHPHTFHSYGGNLDDFSDFKWDSDSPKKYDVISIGVFEHYKRFEKIINFPGKKKLIIGSTNTEYYRKMETVFKEHDIEIKDFVSQAELPNYINQSKCLYIPASVEGGGERIIMEFRNSGIPIVVEDDNPKLKEILTGPNWDEISYGEGIRRGLDDFFSLSQQSSSTLLLPNSKLKVGRNTFHNINFRPRGDEYIEIGSFCAIGKNVQIITSSHDTNYASTIGYLYNNYFNEKHPGELNNPPTRERSKGPVIIGNDVWIGDDVTIMSGVKIGDGACIGTKAVVTKDVEPYGIVAGVPAKLIKKRFSNSVIEQLLQSGWWYWSDQKIKKNKKFFTTNFNMDDFPDIL